MEESTTRARKRALRTALRTGRAGTGHRAADEDALLAGQVDDLLALVDAPQRAPRAVAAFHPTATEPDVRALIRVLHERGHRVLLPVRAGAHVDWAAWDGHEQLAAAPARGFGQEPRGEREGLAALARVGLVLAPALAVDLSGTRLGHGGGYYDRALAPAQGVPVVAVVHPWEVLAAGALPREAHDHPADAALTTEGVVRLPGGRGG
jgi:5-formyltetrahydrofolate cyclo-ligase